MLEMHPDCEKCGTDLPADLPGADRNTETAVPALVFAPATAAWLVDLAAGAQGHHQ